MEASARSDAITTSQVADTTIRGIGFEHYGSHVDQLAAVKMTATRDVLENDVFVDNAAGNNGGAISSSHAPGDGTLHVSYSTFSGNGSVSGGALAGDAVVTASLFEGNTASSGATCDTPFDPPPVDGGYNVADDASCAFTADTSANDTAPRWAPGSSPP